MAISARLKLDENISFLDGHYLKKVVRLNHDVAGAPPQSGFLNRGMGDGHRAFIAPRSASAQYPLDR